MKKYLALFVIVLSLALTGATPSGMAAGELWLEYFGCAGDGVTSDATCMTNTVAAVTRAAKMGRATIHGGCGRTYVIGAGAPYTIPDGVSIVGCGQSTVFKSTTNNTLFQAKGEGIRFAHFKILGSNAGSAEDCFHSWASTSGSSDWIAEDTECNGVGGTGYYIYYAGTVIDMGPMLIANRAIGCGVAGFVVGSEYTVGIGNHARGNGRGLEIDAGNLSWVGGSTTHNTHGIYQSAGVGNDGHGTVADVLDNHNTNALTIPGLSNGMTYIGMQFYYGAINLTNTHGVRIIGASIDVDSINLTNALGTTFEDTTWANSCCANTISQSGSTTLANERNHDLNGNASSIVAAAGWGWSPRHASTSVVFASDANRTATAADYSGDYLVVTSGVSLTATRNLVLPDSPGASFDVFNGTTGAQSVQFIGSSGTGVTVANGKRARIRKDSTNYVRITADN